jgi:hypothetical protein
MKLSKSNKEIILTDLDFILEKMKSTESISEAFYYFTGVNSVLQRVMNIKYDEELLFAYVTTRTVSDLVFERNNAIKNGETTIDYINDFKGKFLYGLKTLRDSIAEDKDTTKALQRLLALAYSTTGNGYFLLQKGSFKLD